MGIQDKHFKSDSIQHYFWTFFSFNICYDIRHKEITPLKTIAKLTSSTPREVAITAAFHSTLRTVERLNEQRNHNEFCSPEDFTPFYSSCPNLLHKFKFITDIFCTQICDGCEIVANQMQSIAPSAVRNWKDALIHVHFGIGVFF